MMQLRNKVIAVSGVDGSGKTLVARNLQRQLENMNIRTKYVWLRYNHYCVKGLLLYCRIMGYTKYENVDGCRIGYHEFYKSKTIAALFIFLTVIDTLIASALHVYIPLLLSDAVVVCDRWILDIMVDLETDTRVRLFDNRFWNGVFMKFIPRRCLTLVITRPEELMLNARKENMYDRNFGERLRLYRQLTLLAWVRVVNNNTTIESVIESVMQKVKWQEW